MKRIILTLLMGAVLGLEMAGSIGEPHSAVVETVVQTETIHESVNDLHLPEEADTVELSTEKSTTESTGLSYISTELSTTEENSEVESELWRYELTEHETALIAYIISFEESDYNALVGCAEVILNRLESDKFPDTIEDVIYKRKQFYAAKFISRGDTPEVDKESEEYSAVMAVFRDGISVVPGALFFANERVPKTKIANGLYEIGHIGETKYWGQE